jgi:hypothetical protein
MTGTAASAGPDPDHVVVPSTGSVPAVRSANHTTCCEAEDQRVPETAVCPPRAPALGNVARCGGGAVGERQSTDYADELPAGCDPRRYDLHDDLWSSTDFGWSGTRRRRCSSPGVTGCTRLKTANSALCFGFPRRPCASWPRPLSWEDGCCDTRSTSHPIGSGKSLSELRSCSGSVWTSGTSEASRPRSSYEDASLRGSAPERGRVVLRRVLRQRGRWRDPDLPCGCGGSGGRDSARLPAWARFSTFTVFFTTR